MFTLFQLLYLVMYFITFSGFFTYTINYLNECKIHGENDNIVDKYISILDEYLFYDLVDNVDNFYDFNKDIDTIMVCVDNSEISKCQLLLLQNLFPDSTKIAICLNNDDSDILKLCEKLNFKYYNKFKEFIYSEKNNRKDFMIEYCKLCDVKYCFMNNDNNELMSVIFDGLFSNNYEENIDNIEKSEEGHIFIYNIFTNSKIFLNYINIWDHYFGNLGNNYIENFYYVQDSINNNWRTNLTLTYNQLKKDDNNLSNKINNLFETSKFKYGVIIKLDNDHLPYWIWENIFSQYCDNLNINVEKQVIQTLYFTITKNKKDDGEILLDWRYNYNNGIFILYNHSELQEILDNVEIADASDFKLVNSLELFLDGNISYNVLNDENDNNYLNSIDIDLNLEDKNNEDIFSYFKFKKFCVNSIVKNISIN